MCSYLHATPAGGSSALLGLHEPVLVLVVFNMEHAEVCTEFSVWQLLAYGVTMMLSVITRGKGRRMGGEG